MSLDVEKARRETPGCQHVLHFNNAGASLMPQKVTNAVTEHLTFEAQIGGYEAYDQARAKIEHFYNDAASMIGAQPEEIAFIENATRAWDMAFYGFHFAPGDRILTAQSEYASNYIAFLQVARKTGSTVEAIPNDEDGTLSVRALENLIDKNVKLIAITHVPTNGGLVNPAAQIGKVARAAGIPYLLDACQSIGQMPVDVNEIGCDILSATGRKFLRGPRATGFLYVRNQLLENLEPPFLDLHAATWTASDDYEMRPDAKRFETWEQNYAGKIGLAVAIDYAMSWGLDAIRERVWALAELLRKQLQSIQGVQVHDLGIERCGIVTFTVQGKDPDKIKEDLARKKVNVSVSGASSTLLDMKARGLSKLVRASVHYYNTEEEVRRFCQKIQQLLKS